MGIRPPIHESGENPIQSFIATNALDQRQPYLLPPLDALSNLAGTCEAKGCSELLRMAVV